ncbi:MAG: DNA alkylation repair protein [Lactococcus lactis]
MINIIEEFRQYKNEENAEKQAAYLRHQFEFIGLKTPERRLLAKDFLKEKKADRQIDWELVFEFWNLPEREFQYLALDYLHQMKKWVIFDDMEKIKKLIVSKSWWDTVDALDELVGHLLLTGRKQATENDSTAYEQVKTLVKEWAQAENFWIRRIAIDCQLSFKNQTDLELLSYNIEKNLLGSSFADEFFITKAIGWALRDLAKTNSAWVIKFIEEHENKMAKLSIREASKHL